MELDKEYLEKLKRSTIDILSKIKSLIFRAEMGLPKIDITKLFIYLYKLRYITLL